MSENYTIVLTDLVASTELNEAIGDVAMARLWREHDLITRDLIRTWRGQEVARSDGFLILFGSPSDAVGFALRYQSTLRSVDAQMNARVGIHTGPVILRANTEVDRRLGAPAVEIDGVALPVAARVMAAARGGQILMTTAVISESPQAGARVVSHGHWRFKGVREPVELLEIGDEDAEFQPPRDSEKAYRVVRLRDEWVPVNSIPNNLPAEPDAFVGRTVPLGQLAGFFEHQARLVTLIGMGGIGKTRLAIRYARTWLGEHEGGSYFCDLAAARGIDGIEHAVAQAFGLPLGKTNIVAQLGAAIAARGPCLVILDNFEQVARHAEATLGAWLGAAPQARFIVTSRELLGIRGEQVLFLNPLTDTEGAQLFRRRALEASHRVLDEQDSEPIGKLVTLLDGLPLAIELAAARSRVMSVRMLLDRMNERFLLLTSKGGRVDRQVTLKATLDWSWDLLDAPERMALAQLSIFEGGFTVEAVEAIVDLTPLPRSAVLDILQSLVEKSLVRRIAADRFDLLVTVQEYAAQRLGDEALSVGPSVWRECEIRHCVYYGRDRELASAMFASLELDNIVVACRRACSHGDLEKAVMTLQSAWAVLRQRGPMTTALDLATAIKDAGVDDSQILSDRGWARVHRILASALNAVGQTAASHEHLRKGLSFAVSAKDARLECELRNALGDHCDNAGLMDEAELQVTAALDIANALRDPDLQCAALSSLASHRESLGRLDEALRLHEEVVRIARASSNRRWEGGSAGNLAKIFTAQGRYAEAEPLYTEAIAIAREVGDRAWEGNALCNLGFTSHSLGKHEKARNELDEALLIARELGQRRLQAVTLCNLGVVADALGELPTARGHFQQAIAVARELGDRRSEGQFLIYLGLLDSKSGNVHNARTVLIDAEAILESVSDLISLGFALCCRAEAEHMLGNVDVAQMVLDRAQRVAADTSPIDDSEFGVALGRAQRRLSSASSSARQDQPEAKLDISGSTTIGVSSPRL